jgi:aminopeptidase
MKPDNRLTKLARLIVQYSTEVQKNQQVKISGSTASEPLVRELYRAVLEAGAHPRVQMLLPDQQYIFYNTAQDFQLDYTDPQMLYEAEHVDRILQIFPDLNPHELTAIDPAKQQKAALANGPIMEAVMKRWGDGSLRWCGTACPTPALAQEAHMSLEEYAEFVFDCMHLNDEDPVAFWKEFSARQDKICQRLDNIREMRYVGEDTDLRFNVAGRKWINCDGRLNFPDGEVFTGPVEDSVEGTIRFTYPGVIQGKEIEDIFLRFEQGKVVEASAAKGEELLQNVLDTDDGSRFVGEVAIGTNDKITRFTKNMLFDEKMGGTVHVAIGRGLPETGSNNVSTIHWDMLKDMKTGGEIYADGELIYQNGQFLSMD